MTDAAPTRYHTRYHKGDLPATLRSAAVEVILDDGLGAFSLREVARRAGVSHAAPGYHFGDVRGLLTSVAIEGFETLARETAAASAGIDDPCERLVAMGRAYVRVGVDYPGHCQVIFRDDVLDHDDEALDAAGLGAYAVLEDNVRAVAEACGLTVSVEQAARLCWSAMQGLVQLHPKISNLDERLGREIIDIEAQSEAFTRMLLGGILA